MRNFCDYHLFPCISQHSMQNYERLGGLLVPVGITLLFYFSLICQSASNPVLLLFTDFEDEDSKITFPDTVKTVSDLSNIGECEKHCTPLDFCSSLFSLLQEPSPSNLQILRNTSCGFDADGTPMHLCEDAICLDRRAQEQSSEDIGFLSAVNTWTHLPITPLRVDSFTTLNEDGCGKALFTDRIQGGEEASRGEYPWIVALIGTPDTSDESKTEVFCAGSLISEEWILTAAHCLFSGSGKTQNISYVRIGAFRLDNLNEVGTVNAKVLKSIPHPEYREVPNIRNDVALLKLTEKVILNPYINPICLPTNEFIAQSSTPMTIAGWGSTGSKTSSNILKKADVRITPPRECFKMYEKYKATLVPSQQICAQAPQNRATDSCTGDSGGPLMATINGSTLVIGVISFGTTVCDGRLPGVYTKVGSYMNWIQDTISKNKNFQPSTPIQSTPSLSKYRDRMT